MRYKTFHHQFLRGMCIKTFFHRIMGRKYFPKTANFSDCTSYVGKPESARLFKELVGTAPRLFSSESLFWCSFLLSLPHQSSLDTASCLWERLAVPIFICCQAAYDSLQERCEPPFPLFFVNALQIFQYTSSRGVRWRGETFIVAAPESPFP